MELAKEEQTATETIISAPETAIHTDKKGRIIKVRRLNALQVYRLTKVLGTAASNPATADMATLACTVCRIDTMDVAFPTTERDVEFLIQKLDFEGIEAAAEALKQLSPQEDVELDAAKN